MNKGTAGRLKKYNKEYAGPSVVDSKNTDIYTKKSSHEQLKVAKKHATSKFEKVL